MEALAAALALLMHLVHANVTLAVPLFGVMKYQKAWPAAASVLFELAMRVRASGGVYVSRLSVEGLPPVDGTELRHGAYV